jgi:hypothetical protein
MPTGMRAVTGNIDYRRSAIGILKENAPMELDGNGLRGNAAYAVQGMLDQGNGDTWTYREKW